MTNPSNSGQTKSFDVFSKDLEAKDAVWLWLSENYSGGSFDFVALCSELCTGVMEQIDADLAYEFGLQLSDEARERLHWRLMLVIIEQIDIPDWSAIFLQERVHTLAGEQNFLPAED